MLGNITDEQFKLINDVYNHHREEYSLWCKNYGLERYKEWQQEHKEKGWMSGEFAYYICEKFMDWKNGNIEG